MFLQVEPGIPYVLHELKDESEATKIGVLSHILSEEHAEYSLGNNRSISEESNTNKLKYKTVPKTFLANFRKIIDFSMSIRNKCKIIFIEV